MKNISLDSKFLRTNLSVEEANGIALKELYSVLRGCTYSEVISEELFETCRKEYLL